MLGAARRDGEGLAARLLHVVHGLFPAGADANVKARSIQAHIGAHDAAHLDVAHAVVHRVGVVHPVLLHQHALHAQVRSHGGHLARLVGLDAANRHQRVVAARNRFGNQVLHLARFVAAKGQARVAVLTLGVQVHLAAQVGRQAR